MRKHAIDFTNSVDMTEQSHKKECDINNIMRKFIKTGNVEHFAKHGGTYGDVQAIDYREAMETIATSNSMFEELPAETRKFFHNDPAEFAEYSADPKNNSKLVELGLARPTQTTEKESKATTEKAATDSKKGSIATSNSEASSDAKASGEGS